MVRLRSVCLVWFLAALMDVTTGGLRGMGASTVPMIMSVLGVCGIRLLWIYTVFAVYHTPDCLYLSYAVSWIATFLAQFVAFWWAYRKHTKTAGSL